MDNLKMLPEYSFMVGHSMQDISRDDFPLLNGGDAVSNSTDKDMCPTLIARIQNISPINPSVLHLPKQLNVEDNVIQNYAPVKLEDAGAIDLFPTHASTWQQHPMNTNQDLAQHRLSLHSHSRFDHNNTKLLLQGSDDPLISHGANSVLSHDDEHPGDFAKCLIAAPAIQHPNIQERLSIPNSSRLTAQQHEQIQQRPIKSGCSNLTKQQLKVKANLMSARNQQQIQINNALLNTSSPLPSASQKQQRNPKVKKKPGNVVKLRFHHQALPPEYLSHYEATQGQVRTSKSQQKLTTTQQRNPTKPNNNHPKQSQSRNSHENVRSWLQKIAEIQRTANASKEGGGQMQQQQQQAHQAPSKSQKDTEKTYETQQISNRPNLDVNNNHSKTQQRHLQTQNQASSTSYASNTNTGANSNGGYFYNDLPYMGEITLDNCKPRRGRKPKKADICHLIYKNYGTILPKQPETQDCPNYANGTLSMKPHANKTDIEEQPLNLCLRDQPADSYSISSGDEISETNSSCPTPITTIAPSDFVRDSMLANNLKNSLSNLNGLEQRDKDKLNASTIENPVVPINKISSMSTTEENALHPVTMYYQKLLESGVLLHNANGPFKTIQKDNQLALKIPIPSGFFLSHKIEKSASSPAPSHLDYPEPLSTPSSIKSENSLTTNSSSAANQQQMTPQKRKRSAIFIPPMNTENTTNPATEVSICKFKFTGGSKPTLQEKKMLSVDAGGNYRYFSGTGDKSTRGYEYFPRESLQQTAGLLPGVNCTGQKLMIDIPPPSAGLSNELLHIPESPTSSMMLPASASSANAMPDAIPPPAAGPTFEVSKNEACSNNFVENSTYPSSSPNTSSSNRCVAPRKKHGAIQQQLRKFTQREKLEKTFKEQGFLIQTQQLESAEGATYCKFRQLKKFTRYLFRNWKDYLPDDLQQSSNAASAEFSNQHNLEDASPLSLKNCVQNAVTSGEENILD